MIKVTHITLVSKSCSQGLKANPRKLINILILQRNLFFELQKVMVVTSGRSNNDLMCLCHPLIPKSMIRVVNFSNTYCEIT